MSDLDQVSHYNLGCLTLLTIMWTWIYGTARVSPQLTRHYWTPYLSASQLEPWLEEKKMKDTLFAWQQHDHCLGTRRVSQRTTLMSINFTWLIMVT